MTKTIRWLIAILALLLLAFWYRSNIRLPDFWDGLVGGLLVAVILGVLVNEWQRFVIDRRIRSFKLAEGEQLLRSDVATQLTGGGGLTGKLFLTDRRLIFVARPAIKEPIRWEIPLTSLTSTGRFNRLGFIPAGLSIFTRKGDTYQFLVSERKAWEGELRPYLPSGPV